ncbi:DHA2 family efflux MFS transporter permease subunit [Marinicrinis lubricantis]|uniref:DHA2 family efflux MFS transporter permease subunit n=1 Tax=Marinicrinis lubricantis TaxID=2086470 RepID=A0ABW1IKL9_9BACL
MNTASAEASPQVNGIDLSKIKKLPIVISLIIGAFIAMLNETVLNVAYTDLMADLNVTSTTVQWLSTGFMLIVGILVPITALLTQWFTTRQMFLSAMIMFTLGTVLCGIAPQFSILLVGRLIQAVGTGLMLPVMMNTILVIFPPEKRGAAMGSIGLVIMVAPAIGPTLSGLIVEHSSWRWLFYMVIPLAVFSVAFAAVYLKNVSDITKPKVDILSIILSTIGFGGVVYGFSSAGEGSGGWSEPEVYLTIAAGLISLILFAWRQLVIKSPMLDLRAFKFPMFSLSVVLLMVIMMTLFSSLIMLPFYLRGALMLSAFTAGLVLLPGGVINGIMAPVAGKLFDKFGPRAMVTPGIVMLIIILWFMSQLTTDASTGYVILLHCLLMIAISMIMMPGQTTGLNQLPRRFYPHGTAIMNTLQQVSGAIGTALFISIMSSRQTEYLESSSNPTAPSEIAESTAAGVQYAFFIGLLFAVGALVLSFFLKRVKPSEE